MKKCNKCNIYVDTSRITCPLCYEVLEETSFEERVSEPYNPYVANKSKRHLTRRIFLYLSIITILICGFVNIITFANCKNLWSLIVLSSIVYLWVLVKGVIMSRKNIALMIILQSFVLGVLFFFIENVAKNSSNSFKPWVIPYIIPFIMIVSMMAITLVIFIKVMRYKDYMMYLVSVVILGFIPLLLYLIPSTRPLYDGVLWPTISSAGYSIATLIGMFIFGDKETKQEFIKRFHI